MARGDTHRLYDGPVRQHLRRRLRFKTKFPQSVSSNTTTRNGDADRYAYFASIPTVTAKPSPVRARARRPGRWYMSDGTPVFGVDVGTAGGGRSSRWFPRQVVSGAPVAFSSATITMPKKRCVLLRPPSITPSTSPTGVVVTGPPGTRVDFIHPPPAVLARATGQRSAHEALSLRTMNVRRCHRQRSASRRRLGVQQQPHRCRHHSAGWPIGRAVHGATVSRNYQPTAPGAGRSRHRRSCVIGVIQPVVAMSGQPRSLRALWRALCIPGGSPAHPITLAATVAGASPRGVQSFAVVGALVTCRSGFGWSRSSAPDVPCIQFRGRAACRHSCGEGIIRPAAGACQCENDDPTHRSSARLVHPDHGRAIVNSSRDYTPTRATHRARNALSPHFDALNVGTSPTRHRRSRAGAQPDGGCRQRAQPQDPGWQDPHGRGHGTACHHRHVAAGHPTLRTGA